MVVNEEDYLLIGVEVAKLIPDNTSVYVTDDPDETIISMVNDGDYSIRKFIRWDYTNKYPIVKSYSSDRPIEYSYCYVHKRHLTSYPEEISVDEDHLLIF